MKEATLMLQSPATQPRRRPLRLRFTSEADESRTVDGA
jgi:hypothetical protein